MRRTSSRVGFLLAWMEGMLPSASRLGALQFVLTLRKYTADFGGMQKIGSQKLEEHMI